MSSPIDGYERDLDPFAYFPKARSRIAGLGGEAPLPSAKYGLHTHYVHARPGPIRFRLRLDDLTATRGRLKLRVSALPSDLNPQPRQVATLIRPLADLARDGGEIVIDGTARPDETYALAVIILDETDASASAATVTLMGAEDGGRFARAVGAGRTEIFGEQRPSFLQSLFGTDTSAVPRVTGPALLTEPVSQMCTAAQFDEPVYDEWVARLHHPRHRHRKQWEFIYILQALERAGALRPGRRGLGFGVGGERLPALMAAMGVDVVATDLPQDDARALEWRATNQHSSELDGLVYPDICDEATLRRHVAFRAVDMNHIPADLTGFDFCWSACAYEHLGSIAKGLRFVEASIATLRPGGVAVHTSELNLTSNRKTVDNQGTVLFRRRDMEKLAARLIAAGHAVAPFNFDQGEQPDDQHIDMPPYGPEHLKVVLGPYVTTSFGIIVRKKGN
ncbi:hypothetical protein PQ455_08710 [Sphingomonas naphthae]|uniref:Class I SAM-dependent methyltransferase n=1 Tax=Sphingomonas naphthae TaxID=1813468 RepID=A0ABY7TRK7_9SPHN|nr:hypothetical protein [Sphingomonas naphthae]WCT75282.1 hypothetical protein PQ455_08710 [Sphingomonas naphthae]